MSKSRNVRLIVIGMILVLCLPLLAIVPWILGHYLPRQYFSSAIVEMDTTNWEERTQAVQVVMQPFDGAAEFREVRNTDLFELGIYDRNPQQAADKANSAAISLQQRSPFPVHILERAEPARYPARPNVGILTFLGAGLLFAAVGVILLIIGLIGATNVQKSLQST